MALTLLQVENLALHKAGIISSDLTALTSQSMQADVDSMIEATNEVIGDLCRLGSWPSIDKDGTITLVASTRGYAVATDFVSFADDLLRDTTNGYILYPYPGGYIQMIRDQTIPANFTGKPSYWSLDVTNGQIYINTSPTSAEAGLVYHYLYRKQTFYVSSSPTDTFPVKDQVLHEMLPAIVEVFNRDGHRKVDDRAFKRSLANSAALLSQLPKRDSYGPDC